jgi:hypothetical protein
MGASSQVLRPQQEHEEKALANRQKSSLEEKTTGKGQ